MRELRGRPATKIRVGQVLRGVRARYGWAQWLIYGRLIALAVAYVLQILAQIRDPELAAILGDVSGELDGEDRREFSKAYPGRSVASSEPEELPS